MSEKITTRINIWLKDTSKELNISYCGLTEWPDALSGKDSLIIKLNCSWNQLTSLPVFSNLIRLSCHHNQLTSLPSLLKLTIFSCHHNQLTSIPGPSDLPKLTIFSCRNNQLTLLPSLPKLTYLDCDKNQLTSLPVYPKLTTLYCSRNQLTSLPVYPNLTKLYCVNNQLTSNGLVSWKKIWRLQNLRKSELRKRGLEKALKIMRLRLYLPRLNELKQELVYSPNHPGKFYKTLRLGDWSK